MSSRGQDAGALIRPIEARDDEALAAIIPTVLREFLSCGADSPIDDPEVAAMSAAYAPARHRYLVAELAGRIVGGGGIAPLAGADPSACELRKMYLVPEARGHGFGRRLLEALLAAAREDGYETCHLETSEPMQAARRLYEANGFERREKPIGVGHGACNLWYSRAL